MTRERDILVTRYDSVLLMNPNSNTATTEAMVRIARHEFHHVVPPVVPHVLQQVHGWTAPSGPSLLTSEAALDAAAVWVAQAEIPADISGVIVSAFGDPGRAQLAARLSVPVVGIGHAAAIAAAKGGRRFAVVTHTPGLVRAIDALMRASTPRSPPSQYLGTFLTEGDPLAPWVGLGADPVALDAALETALEAAILRAYAAGAEAVILGGGPLAEAAERLRARVPCPLIAPIPEAAHRLQRLIAERT